MGSRSLSPASRELVESNVVQPGPCDSKAIRPGWKGGWNTLTEYLAADNKASKDCDPPLYHLNASAPTHSSPASGLLPGITF